MRPLRRTAPTQVLTCSHLFVTDQCGSSQRTDISTHERGLPSEDTKRKRKEFLPEAPVPRLNNGRPSHLPPIMSLCIERALLPRDATAKRNDREIDDRAEQGRSCRPKRISAAAQKGEREREFSTVHRLPTLPRLGKLDRFTERTEFYTMYPTNIRERLRGSRKRKHHGNLGESVDRGGSYILY
ncbi:hypothetical protein HPB50_006489 [Hyalomma asiaticum]|uniref:Uncharacterized protein n=1 Tax=Hyalomma asiaticum TaxID=266040 RepID=A0ACB7SBK2_HYAAI|nr:hypothetical protein HPB50_006489 [Hyalomma asiaticum]